MEVGDKVRLIKRCADGGPRVRSTGVIEAIDPSDNTINVRFDDWHGGHCFRDEAWDCWWIFPEYLEIIG